MTDAESRDLRSIDIFITLLWMSGLEKIPTDKRKLLLALYAAGDAFSRIHEFAGMHGDPYKWFRSHRITDGVEDELFTLNLSGLIDIAPFTGMREYVLNRKAIDRYVESTLRPKFTEEQWEQCIGAGIIFAKKIRQYKDLDTNGAFRLDFPNDR